jgi:hypothetical protein
MQGTVTVNHIITHDPVHLIPYTDCQYGDCIGQQPQRQVGVNHHHTFHKILQPSFFEKG